MPSNNGNSIWIAITVGLPPRNFERAAIRVEKDLRNLYSFKRILNFTAEELAISAPRTLEKYREFLNEETPGFGFYCWKSEIVNNVLNGAFGECDGIVWIDAGCEIFSTPWTRKKFLKQLHQAEECGSLVFELDTPENCFTKHDVFDAFPSVSYSDTSPQVQATHFFLHGKTGKAIANTWLEAGLRGIEMFDLSPSVRGEHNKFVSHKSDQSLLSLSIKSLDITKRMPVPPAGNRGFLYRISAMRAPVWVARNRDGKSLKGQFLSLIERIAK